VPAEPVSWVKVDGTAPELVVTLYMVVTHDTSSPYATGGGGTVLEHRYGATLLAHLLTGDPISLLGDDVLPVQIRFQGRGASPVDDIVVTGRLPNGRSRRLSIGVRRSPSFVPSSKATVKLLAPYLVIVVDHWPDIVDGHWRLGLAATGPDNGMQQISQLATLARAAPAETEFRTKVTVEVATKVRDRLKRLDELVAIAARNTGSVIPPTELTWRLLFALWPVEIHVEGADQRDRSETVSRLRGITRPESLSAADALSRRLTDLVGDYAPAGAVVTESTLRRDLAGFSLARSPLNAQGWSVLGRLAERLRDRTGSRLATADKALEVDRIEARTRLLARLREVGTQTGVLIVHGDPDVGKSALTLRVVEELRSAGAGVAALSLRDLPSTMVEFESALNGGLCEVLGGAPVGDVRLLVIDGAEAALEGRQALLTDVATASLRAGLGVAAVTRADGFSAVAESLGSAQRAAGHIEQQLAEHEVPPFDIKDVAQLTDTFAGLTKLAEEPRSAWVLCRPGLVDLLLRGEVVRALPGSALSEADVFAAIWHGLVRRTAAGPPDAREYTLMSFARRLLLPGTASPLALDVSALPSLRSDGLLLSSSPTGAWNRGEEFASDLVRDMAVARLLLVEGWSLVVEAGVPRWALRAVRLACQAKLAETRAGAEVECRQQYQVFEAIADEYGRRWAELPFEAMLTLGTADRVLPAVWPGLNGEQRAILIRLGVFRYTHGDIGDTAVLTPLIELSFCQARPLKVDDQGRLDVDHQVQSLVLAWLRSLADEDAGDNPVRQAVRDAVLDASPTGRDGFAVETVALLGADLDARAEDYLRGVVRHDSRDLLPAIRSESAIWSMAASKSDLLLELTAAFCLAPTGRWGLIEVCDTFFPLMIANPAETLPIIQQLLNRAAANVDKGGLELEFSDGARRVCRGDSNTWRWAEPGGLAPKYCASALLAVRRFFDDQVMSGAPIAEIVDLLLHDCENLAMPGLVVELLMRNIASVDREFDQWLAQPEVWEMEHRRRHSIFPTVENTSDENRHACDIRVAAARLVIDAMDQRSQKKVEALEATAAKLLCRVQQYIDNNPTDTTVAANGYTWADYLRAENFRVTWQDERIYDVDFIPPQRGKKQDIEVESDPDWDRERRLSMIAMQYTGIGGLHPGVEIHEDCLSKIAGDLAFVRDLPVAPPTDRLMRKAIDSVAVAAIVAHVQGKITLVVEDFRWAADNVMDIALARQDDLADLAGRISMAMVQLTLPPFRPADIDYRRLEKSLIELAATPLSRLDDVLGSHIRPLWIAPCFRGNTSGRCPHEIAWKAIDATIRHCTWEPGAIRLTNTPLQGHLEKALTTVPTERLILEGMPGPLTACIGAAYSGSCVANRAKSLLGVLLDTYQRAFIHQANRPSFSQVPGDFHQGVAGALMIAAASNDPAPLVAHVRVLAGNPNALGAFLRDMSCQATDDAEVRHTLPSVWPLIMETTLESCRPSDDQRYRVALAALVPEPRVSRLDAFLQPPSFDFENITNAMGIAWTNPDDVVAAARTQWIAPESLQQQVDRWIPLVRGEPCAVDILIGLARTAPLNWQAATGLRWVEKLIGDDYYLVSVLSRRLLDWLIEVHSSGLLASSEVIILHRMVDALAAEGSPRAVKLQMTLE
jgi:hypothetical protein